MAKRRIQLTESQLFRLIERSLNELDWRTYASAANKRMNQAGDYARNNNTNITNSPSYKKSFALNNAAAKAFNKKHGYSQRDNGGGWYMNSMENSDPNARNTNAVRYTADNNGQGIDNPYRKGKYSGWKSDRFTSDNDSDVKDMTDFQSGKSQYNKQTNQWESVAHTVSKNVIRKLHEAVQSQEPYLWVEVTNFEEDDEKTDKLIDVVYHGGDLSQFDPYHGAFPKGGFTNAEIGKDNDPNEEYYPQRWDFGEWFLWRKAYLSEIIDVLKNEGGLPNDASDEAKEFVEKYCSQPTK